jgi:hypothetical protein
MNRFRTRVCLGIAVDEHEMIRVAAVGTNELTSPWPLELRSFPNLASFQGYWLEELEDQYGIDRVGLTFVGCDDLGIWDWLDDRGITGEIYEVPTFVFCREVQLYKVPGPFEEAYDQALACLLREKAPEFTALITAKVRKLDQELGGILAQLNCLHTALTCHSRCPF